MIIVTPLELNNTWLVVAIIIAIGDYPLLNISELKWPVERARLPEVGAARHRHLGGLGVCIMLFEPLLRIILDEALGRRSHILSFEHQLLEYSFNEVLLVIERVFLLFKFELERLFFLRYGSAMDLQLLLKTMLEIVREHVILLFNRHVGTGTPLLFLFISDFIGLLGLE